MFYTSSSIIRHQGALSCCVAPHTRLETPIIRHQGARSCCAAPHTRLETPIIRHQGAPSCCAAPHTRLETPINQASRRSELLCCTPYEAGVCARVCRECVRGGYRGGLDMAVHHPLGAPIGIRAN